MLELGRKTFPARHEDVRVLVAAAAVDTIFGLISLLVLSGHVRESTNTQRLRSRSCTYRVDLPFRTGFSTFLRWVASVNKQFRGHNHWAKSPLDPILAHPVIHEGTPIAGFSPPTCGRQRRSRAFLSCALSALFLFTITRVEEQMYYFKADKGASRYDVRIGGGSWRSGRSKGGCMNFIV